LLKGEANPNETAEEVCHEKEKEKIFAVSDCNVAGIFAGLGWR